MKKKNLIKLPENIVNQIAAGEVVERPASIVKELVDNALDAQASKIAVKVKNGGIDMIEVTDNGVGIAKDDLPFIFDAHTTSKMRDMDDLNMLLSMGFRGEALSTIISVAKVSLSSKYMEEEFANEIQFNEEGKSIVKKTAKERGTTVKVEDVFYNIPARKKYLKTPQTEYRKIYELLNSYYLVYPNIHFLLEKDGKNTLDLETIPDTKAGDITEERIEKIMSEDASNFLKLFYEGSGIKINGYVAHPSKHKSSRAKSYIFINNRPISDNGIYRAIYEGYSRYLPVGQKIDFAINITLQPHLVDINVHPRKEEVRFENPYRVYSAVEQAVKYTLEKGFSFEKTPSNIKDFSTMRERFNKGKKTFSPDQYYSKSIYTTPKPTSVEESLLFSKELLATTPEEFPWEESEEIRNLFQVFNKYIVIEFVNEKLWIIDQHAAAERISFEKLQRGRKGLDIQNLLVPTEIKLRKEELLFLEESKEFFTQMGILYDLKTESILLKTVPIIFVESDFKTIFDEIFAIEKDIPTLRRNLDKKREDILATISCHSSIRSGQKLQREEMLNLYKELSRCKNPYSCPHGRPAVWKLTLAEIDANFERTY